MRVSFVKLEGTSNTWEATVTMDPEAEVDTNVIADVGGENAAGNVFLLNFDNLGTIQSVQDDAGDLLDVGALQVAVSFDVAGATPEEEGVLIRQTFNLNIGEVGSAVDAVTQFAEQSSTKAFKQNGYPMGYLESYKIDQSGVITGVYSNGSNRTLGQVALASFTNPGGLEKAGESTYAVSINSGDPNVAPSGVAGKGKILAGALEMSNVDLAEQFTDMIVTQRGFQANSKTIQTSDAMLQELLTLKR
jgi:flagellar hook protein FlgE